MEGRRKAPTGRSRSGTNRANGAKRTKGALWTRATGARSAGLARFGIVGASGILVNELAIAGLVSGLGLHYVVGYLLATQCSTLWNFALIETWAFRNASPTNRRWHRFAMLMVVNNIANVLTAPLYVAFTSLLGINYLVSNILTLAVVFVGRFAIAERIWGGASAAKATRPIAEHEDGPDAGDPPPRPAVAAAAPATEHDELVVLRARVGELEYEREQLERELADARNSAADQDTVLPSHREHRGHQPFGRHKSRSAKWFPAG